ncbi:MAG: helix-turn-helix domain-containing protein [Xanthomonadales bacterium]|nr:helix-turn-helix domain-containing protein [Xanthomonadales bacterium]
MPSPPSPLSWHTPAQIQAQLATRLRALRLRLGWTQATLAARAGVSLPTVRRFERDGQTTLGNFLRLTHALGALDELAELFASPALRSLDELARAAAPLRLRGRR